MMMTLVLMIPLAASCAKYTLLYIKTSEIDMREHAGSYVKGEFIAASFYLNVT